METLNLLVALTSLVLTGLGVYAAFAGLAQGTSYVPGHIQPAIGPHAGGTVYPQASKPDHPGPSLHGSPLVLQGRRWIYGFYLALLLPAGPILFDILVFLANQAEAGLWSLSLIPIGLYAYILTRVALLTFRPLSLSFSTVGLRLVRSGQSWTVPWRFVYQIDIRKIGGSSSIMLWLDRPESNPFPHYSSSKLLRYPTYLPKTRAVRFAPVSMFEGGTQAINLALQQFCDRAWWDISTKDPM